MSAPAVAAAPRLPPTSLFINRELSWLEFNARVLHEAADPRVPLLERVKFLSIFSTNLDEFYMVRVAGLRRKAAQGAQQYPPDGMTPGEQLAAVRARVRELLAARDRCLDEELLPALADQGITFVRMADLTPAEWMRSTSSSRRRCSRCSRRSRSTRGTRSRTSPTCRCRSRWSCATPTTRSRSTSRASRCRGRSPAGCPRGSRGGSCRSRR
jgi:hypothetical protein